MSDALLGATLLALGGSANDFMIGFVSVPGLHLVRGCDVDVKEAVKMALEKPRKWALSG